MSLFNLYDVKIVVGFFEKFNLIARETSEADMDIRKSCERPTYTWYLTFDETGVARSLRNIDCHLTTESMSTLTTAVRYNQLSEITKTISVEKSSKSSQRKMGLFGY